MKKLNSNITGVVMAGGKSSRMGTDKGLMDFNGRIMVTYAIELLADIFENVVISTNNIAYEKFGHQLIPDIHKNCGPMGGLHAVLSQLQTQYAFILSCDMPYITSNQVKSIINSLGSELIVIAEVEGNFEPLCSLYHVSLAGELESNIQQGKLKMHQLIRNTTAKRAINFNKEFFRNINAPADLEEPM